MSKKRILLLLSLSIIVGLALVAEPTFAEPINIPIEDQLVTQSEKQPSTQPEENNQPTSQDENEPSSKAPFDPEDFSITLSPSTQALELKPNDVYDGSVNVMNSGKIPITFTVKTAPFYIADDEYSPDYMTVNRYTELANWVSFDQTEYHVKPGETARVDFRVEVPTNAVGGGQYAAIMIYSEDSADPDATVRTASQLAAILYGHVEGDEAVVEGTITEHRFPWLVAGGPLEILASAKNTGNVDFTMRQTVTIKNFFTNEEYFGPNSADADGNLASAHETVVMPGTSRADIIIWEKTPRIGLYRVEQTITVLDETITETKLILFCPIWILILAISLVILLILWIALAIIRHHRHRSRVF